MHERRNTIFILVFSAAMLWAIVVCIVPMAIPPMRSIPLLQAQRLASLALLLVLGSLILYELYMRDRLKDHLASVAAGHYYERDGLCFMPVVRVVRNAPGGARAEICLYYQNRFSGVCETVIHMRPPEGSLFSHKGARDIHFAFRANAGAFGVIHQPVAVRNDAQGKTLDVQLAAAVRWPRHRGDELRSKTGTPVGSFDVDWALAYRQSRHELCGEIELREPVTLHMAMPNDVQHTIERGEFTQELIDSLEKESLSPA